MVAGGSADGEGLSPLGLEHPFHGLDADLGGESSHPVGVGIDVAVFVEPVALLLQGRGGQFLLLPRGVFLLLLLVLQLVGHFVPVEGVQVLYLFLRVDPLQFVTLYF